MAKPNKPEQTLFQMQRAIFLLNKSSDQMLFKKLNLRYSQFLVMMVLASQTKVPQKYIASALDETQAAVSRQVDILVDSGYVSRTKNPEAKREHVLMLTPHGEKLFIKAYKEITKSFSMVTSHMTDKEIQILDQTADRLVKAIKKSSLS